MPLSILANETGAVILLIVHLNKRTDGGAQQRFSGFTAWTAAPRVGFMVAEDPLTKQRFMLTVKNNIGDDRLGYQYHIAEKLIQYGGQTFKSSYIVWDQTTNRSVGELLTPPKVGKGSVVGDAKAFLEDELNSGPLPVEQIKASAKAAGISWPSVIRAKKDMFIGSTKVVNGWTWTLFASKRKIMSEWIENSNGNHVYVIDTDDLMTGYKRGEEWFGIYDNRFTEDGFVTSGKAMAFKKKPSLLIDLTYWLRESPCQQVGGKLKQEVITAFEVVAR